MRRVPPPLLSVKSSYAAALNDAALAAVKLRVDHDLVWLRRRVRVAAEQAGLDERRVHSLSSASYEASRLLFSKAGAADVDIVLSPAAELQVTVRIRSGEGADLTSSLALGRMTL